MRIPPLGIQNNRELRQRGEKRIGSGVASERFANVGKTIHVAGAENKAAAQLEGVFPQLVLVMASGPRAFSAHGVIFAQKMQQVCRCEPRNSISPALLVD